MRMGLGTLGLAVGLGVLVVVTPANAGTPEPDGEVKLKHESYIGHGVLNTTGSGQTASAIRVAPTTS